MLNRNKESIIYQSYQAFGELSYEIANKTQQGLDGKELDCDWYRLIQIDQLLDCIMDFVEIQNNSVYRVIGISDQEFNKLLACLEHLAGIHDYPTPGYLISKDASKLTIGAASPGPAGTNGVSSYNAVAFAADAIGADFSTTPSALRPYIAFITSTTPIPLVPATFAGKWVKYIGDAGVDGVDGEDGGRTWEHIRYASDASGTNFSSTPDISRKYVAFLTTEEDYFNNPPTALFNGLWAKYIGENGAPGTDGEDANTILLTSGAPSNAVGSDGDVAIDTLNWNIHYKSNGAWSAGVSLIGPVGGNGANGANGTNGAPGEDAYVYIGWADDAAGNGYTSVFNPNKDWIAFFQSDTEIAPTVSTFTGLWAKYRGDGDNWKTFSITSLPISTGVKSLIVGTGLAYSTGQRFVIARDNDPSNRMEGLVISYDQVTGQFTGDVTDAFGSGTYSSWDVNLAGALTGTISADSYYAEIKLNGGVTSAATNATYAKLMHFTALGDVSPGMTASFTNDNITPGAIGEFNMYGNLLVSGDANAEFLFQIFKDGVGTGIISGVKLDASGNAAPVSLQGLRAAISGEVYDLRVKSTSGTPNIVVEEGVFGMFTTGTPAEPEYTQFGGPDFDIGTGVIIDAFPTTLGDAVIWEYKIKKGNNIRTGRIQGCWDGLGNDNMDDSFSLDLGTVDVTLDVDINGGNVRLKADITSNDWAISGNRYIL